MKNDVRICILQRGWVVVGQWSVNAKECRLENAYVIAHWGTTKGIGQLAIEGPTAQTVLHQVTTFRYQLDNEVGNMVCTHKKWQELCK